MDRLGEGGYGTVYRGWDPENECHVAIKVLHPKMSAHIKKSFERELAASQEELDHPNILLIEDSGYKFFEEDGERIKDGGPVSYIVSELAPYGDAFEFV